MNRNGGLLTRPLKRTIYSVQEKRIAIYTLLGISKFSFEREIHLASDIHTTHIRNVSNIRSASLKQYNLVPYISGVRTCDQKGSQRWPKLTFS